MGRELRAMASTLLAMASHPTSDGLQACVLCDLVCLGVLLALPGSRQIGAILLEKPSCAPDVWPQAVGE